MVRRRGTPTVSATFLSLKEARDWSKRTEAKVLTGKHFPERQARQRTLADVIERYIADVLPHEPEKAQSNKRLHLAWWRALIGDLHLSELNQAKIVECRDILWKTQTKTGRPRCKSTVNRYLSSLGRALTVAEKDWGWVHENPMRKVARLAEPRGRVRFLNKDEITRLLVACEGNQSSLTS